MRNALLCLSLLAGCDAGSPKTDCVGAVSNVLSLANAKLDDRTAQIKNALFSQCSDTHWSPAATRCIRESRTRDDVASCALEDLTTRQGDAFNAVAAPLLEAMEKGPIAMLGEFANRMCACKDTQCAKAISDEMVKWSEQAAKKQPRPPKMSVAQTKQVTELGVRMGQCMSKAMAIGGAQ